MLGTIFNSKKRSSNNESSNESLKKIRTEELITRPTTQGLGLKEQTINIIPSPDIIEFYDADFKKQTETENLSREKTPYFISKYFNPLRFDKTGSRLDTHDDTWTTDDIERQKNYEEAGEAIQKNQNFTCSKTLNSGFFNKEKLNEETDIIILLYVFSGKTSAILNGFIMGNDLNIIPEDEPEESKENVFYIDAICANPRQPRREGPVLPKISFGKKLLDHVKEFAQKKGYDGISLSSLMYVINYYRRNEFKHLPKLDGITEKEEDSEIKVLAEKFAKAKFKDDAEIEDYMFVELAMMNTEDDEAKKKAAIKKYWEERNLFKKEDSDDEIVNEIFTNYNEKFNDSSDIGKFIKKLSEKGFSTQRKIYDNIPKNERKSKRVMIKSIIQDESNPSSEGFKMTYQFPIKRTTAGGKKQRKTKKQTKRKFKKHRKYKTKKQRKSVRKQATKKSKRKSRKTKKN